MINKKNLRKELKGIVEALDSDYIAITNKAIYDNINKLEEYKNSKTIFCFVGTSKEIDTSVIIQESIKNGKRVGVPKCINFGIMEVREIKSLDDLEVGKYNLQEPKEHCKVMSPSEIDFGIIPCLSSNSKGERLGYGGGFYDRYLENTSFIKAVLCRAKVMYENIPIDKYDIKMNIVINEIKVIRL